MKIKPFEEKKALSNGAIHENPLLNRIYQNRNVKSADDIDYNLSKLINPQLMKGMNEGTDVIINHILAGSKILVVGDYDCDGATSTTIAVDGLRMLGAKDVEFLIPDRQIHGYGLSEKIVALAEKFKPDLIITVDNGIAAFEGALAVRALSKPCQLLITDHHLPAESGEVPVADAIINPSQPGCGFPSKNIAGCGVMFYTIMGTRAKMRQRGLFEKLNMKEPRLNPLLDVLALGTIADVVKLDLNNRVMVAAGLEWINSGMCRPGLRKILELKKKEIGKIVASDFGFAAGPCINAAGRLDDMTIGIKCLLERENEEVSDALAQRLFDLNETRREIESGMVEDALDVLDEINPDQQGIIIYHPDWHEGVVGIVASRIKDRTDKPVLCFTDTHEMSAAKSKLERAMELGVTGEKLKLLQDEVGNCDIKASGRAIPGIHLKHILDEISKKRPEMLYKFGGHAMAAGLSFASKYMDEFTILFNDIVTREMTDEMKRGLISVDIDNIDPSEITLENAELIHNAAIWGQGFEPPIFSQRFEVIEKRPLSEDKHLKMKVRVKGTTQVFDAIAFNCIDRGVHPVDKFAELSFKLDINEWKGRRSVQLMVDHIQDPELAKTLEIAKSEKEKPINIDGVVKNQNKGLKISYTEDLPTPF
jgi:single-stranded-DNA-specific exonuclease